LSSWSVAANRWWRVLLALVVAVLLLAVLLLIRIELTIEARGELQPLTRRNIFAPCDGDVRELHVTHDQAVEAGQLLAELRSAKLDLEFRRVQGEMDAARERLRAIESARVLGQRGDDDPRRSGQLSATQEELKHLLASYQQQLDILLGQREALQLRSPIEGRVLTWDIEQRLRSRPVRRGESLLRVADVQGPWILELEVPDHEIGQVLDARRNRQAPLRVSYILETRPDITFYGELREIAGVSQSLDEEPAAVIVRVDLERRNLPDPRPGASVVARLHCGRRPVGYVWFRQFIEFVQSRLFF
jgi:multidrug efflux pump subunit AcrA (membrane-fusion protein)